MFGFIRNIFWGSAAAGSLPVALSTGRALVAYRSEHVFEPHTYGVIGGAIDERETPEMAALRELQEETEYTGPVKLIPAYIFKDKSGFRYYNFIAAVPEEFLPHPNWETEYFAWVDLPRLSTLEPKHFGLRALLNDKISRALLERLCSL